jgi:hypothetical protein
MFWASTERQRWIIYATFGHTAAELSDPGGSSFGDETTLIMACTSGIISNEASPQTDEVPLENKTKIKLDSFASSFLVQDI